MAHGDIDKLYVIDIMVIDKLYPIRSYTDR